MKRHLFVRIALLAAGAFTAALTFAQAPKTSPTSNAPAKQAAPNYQKIIGAALQAHVKDYLGDEKVAKESLKIMTINDSPFDKLKHRLSVGRGGVEYWGGRPIPEAGSSIRLEFLDPSDNESGIVMITVNAIADGKGSIASFESTDIVEGTRLTLKNGMKFKYHDSRWVRS